MSRILLLFAAAGAALLSPAPAQEPPGPDLVFERWVRDNFFDGYKPPAARSRWDLPAAANRDHGGIPVNILAVKHGTAVDLGEALRQYEIDEPFMLIVGFWEQDGDERRFVNLIAPVVTPGRWRQLWGPVTYADLRRLDALIRDTGPSIEEVRRRALHMRNSPPFTGAIIQVNPKIDERGQRRLQCSLRFEDVFRHLAPGADPGPVAGPALFGVPYPGGAAPAVRSQRED